MLKFLSWTVAALTAALMLLAAPALAAPLSAYGRLPLLEDAQISPDATMMAYVVTNGDQRSILIKDMTSGKTVRLLAAGDQKVRDLAWAGSRYLLIMVSKTQYVADLSGPTREYTMALVYDLKTDKQTNLMARAPDAMNVIIGSPQVRIIDGELTALVEGVDFSQNPGRDSLFAIRLSDGRTRIHERGRSNTNDWVVAADGTVLAQSEYDQVKGDWSLKVQQNNSWQTLEKGNSPLAPPYLAGLGRDGASSLMIFSEEDSDTIHGREYPADGSAPRPVTLPNYDRLIRHPVTHALIGTETLVGETLRYTFFDPRDQAVWKGVAKAYPGQTVRLVSWSDDRRKIVVRVDSPIEGIFYALVDLDQKRADHLGDVYPDLKPADIAEIRFIKYKAADGLEISGYLTLPRGRAASKLPLIVLPHGGPAARDEPGFDWWSQALASKGYAVLQPNFRGSDGLGRAFREAGYGEWGKKMQTDLSDGVRSLAAQGIIDPARVCIVGASYGGYAALAGATIDRGVYRCAVSVAGLSDLRRFLQAQLKAENGRETATQRYWSRFLGVDNRRDPDLAAISPIGYAARVDVPVLLIHGKDDTVVLYDQSQVMFDALRKAGKPVELVTLKGEDHWLSRGGTRQQMLDATAAFLIRNNPPD